MAKLSMPATRMDIGSQSIVIKPHKTLFQQSVAHFHHAKSFAIGRTQCATSAEY
jgi:hypothetical protein